jgi:cytochrome c-type biogenesis protein CcmE
MRVKNISARLLIIVGIAAVLVVVLLKVFNDNISLFLKPAEVYEMQSTLHDEFRIGGFVKDLKFDIATESYSFTITDNKYDIVVEYKGMLPSLFKEGQMSVVGGIIKKCQAVDTICFKASEVLAKHDENYKPPTNK